jgi:tetratricopeptide (TPR) repeat protein
MTHPAGRVTGVRTCALSLALVVAMGSMAPPGAAPRTGLTGAPALARAYDAVFDARFDQVPALLTSACGRDANSTPRAGTRAGTQPALATPANPALAPPEACQVVALAALWWQIQLDPMNPAHDEDFRTTADAAIAAMRAWTAREPERAEAWFYLGGAYGARVQWRVLRGERLAAARDGKNIKDALERALQIDPGLQDAFFGIGLYHYYAAVAPTAAKVLRWLLFLPGGDRAQGLREMLRARDGGQLLRSEADYQLHVLYLWYEQQPERARELVRGLRDRHPRNPHFAQVEAEIEDAYLHDVIGSRRTWAALLEAARAGRVATPAVAETRARLGLARQLDVLHESDAAVEHLRHVIEARPSTPYGALARAHLQLGQALDHLGQRDEAVRAYRAAIEASPKGDPLHTAADARAGLRVTPDAVAARAYRLSIEGWRAFERGQLGDASRVLSQSLTLRPGDQIARVRLGRVRLAQKDDAGALDAFEQVIASGETDPPAFFALACIDAARLYEQRGDPIRAIASYTLANEAFGVDAESKTIARRALARLDR